MKIKMEVVLIPKRQSGGGSDQSTAEGFFLRKENREGGGKWEEKMGVKFASRKSRGFLYDHSSSLSCRELEVRIVDG